MNINPLIRGQQMALAWRRASADSSLMERSNPFRAPGSRESASKSPVKTASDRSMTARGTHFFTLKDQFVEIGDSGVRVKVNDLSLSFKERETVIGGSRYINPLFTKAGAVEIIGTDGDDRVNVSQNLEGNTIVEILHNGRNSSIDLGKIAAVTLHGGAGDDRIAISGSDYYGGVRVYGGDGDDEISVRADYSLRRGIVVEGGAGDDKINISGEALAVLVRGDDGNDTINAKLVENVVGGLAVLLYGGAGDDMIYGSSGRDHIYGGAGNDFIAGGAGNDLIFGEGGNDIIYGGSGDDIIYGGSGDDRISGGAGRDLIYGEDGDDILMGNSGGDIIYGGAGDDYLYGGSSMDDYVIYGDSGQVMVAGFYNFLIGGSGVDTFAPSSESPFSEIVYNGEGNALIDYDSGVDILV